MNFPAPRRGSPGKAQDGPEPRFSMHGVLRSTSSDLYMTLSRIFSSRSGYVGTGRIPKESMQSRGGSSLFGAITEPPLDRINQVDYRAHACRLPSGTVLAVITERKMLGKPSLLA